MNALRRLKTRWKDLRAKRWFQLTTDVLMVAIIMTIAGLWQTRSVRQGPAPAFSLPQLVQANAGDVVSLESLKGRSTVLAFWAPWCGVCRTEASNVSRAASWAGQNARVLSVASSYESLDEVTAFVQNHSVDYPVLLDGTGQVAPSFGVTAYPTLVFLDEHGVIKHATVGYTTTLGILLRLWF